jgi:hypothetical protein
MIDFEFAGYRHALTDFASFFVPGSMWITVADPGERGVEDEYRRILSNSVPQASDDREYGLGIAGASLVSAFHRLHRFPYVDKRPEGHLSRVQLVSTLEAAAMVAYAHAAFPNLSGWAASIAAALRRRWSDADVDFGLHEAYTPRID